MKTIASLTYNCTDEHTAALSDLVTKLEEIVANFKDQLPQVDGLLLRPVLRKEAKLLLQKNISQNNSAIPQPPKRDRKKQSHKYRNRVGQKAQRLRKVWSVEVYAQIVLC